MIAFLVTATIISIKIVVMMKKCGFAATRTRGIFPLIMRRKGSANPCNGSIRSKLVETFTALIFLVTKFVFAIAIKFLRIVAFWTRN